jgi:hypothetical protein
VAKGLEVASLVALWGPSQARNLKDGLLFGERVPTERCSFFVCDSVLEQVTNSGNSGISWLLIPLLSKFLELITWAGLSRPGLPRPDGCEGIGGGPLPPELPPSVCLLSFPKVRVGRLRTASTWLF